MIVSKDFSQSMQILEHADASHIPQRALHVLAAAIEYARHNCIHVSDYLEILLTAKKAIINTYPLDARLYSFTDKITQKLSHIKSFHDIDFELARRLKVAQHHINLSHRHLPKIISLKLAKHKAVFVWGNSQQLIHGLAERRIPVITSNSFKDVATKLAQFQVPVTVCSDTMLRLALKQVSVVYLDAFAIDYHIKAYGHMGCELIAELAKARGIPVYIIADSWAYYPLIALQLEELEYSSDKRQVWADPPKGVKIAAMLHEKVDSTLITGIICEQGIFSPATFAKFFAHEQ